MTERRQKFSVGECARFIGIR